MSICSTGTCVVVLLATFLPLLSLPLSVLSSGMGTWHWRGWRDSPLFSSCRQGCKASLVEEDICVQQTTLVVQAPVELCTCLSPVPGNFCWRMWIQNHLSGTFYAKEIDEDVIT